MPTDQPLTIARFIAEAIEPLAPLHLAQPWDNVGLLAGDPAAPCRHVHVCIDLTPPVLDAAVADRADLLICYHPPIFRPVKAVRADASGPEALVCRALMRGIAIYSPHTALDAADGGTADTLARACGLTDLRPFAPLAPEAPNVKLTTFVPPEHADDLADALFAAGAGRIGDYEKCSFRLTGQGTFFGTESTSPAVGEKGRFERVDEIRLEMVAPRARLPEILAALRTHHPYEEPAYDLYALAPEPTAGAGRIGRWPQPISLTDLVARLKRATAVPTVTVGHPALWATGTPPPDPATIRLATAAVGVGAIGTLPLDDPRARQCDILITGELRHHEMLACLRAGMAFAVVGHSASERPGVRAFAENLAARFPAVAVRLSPADSDPARLL